MPQVFLRDGYDQEEFGTTLNDQQNWPARPTPSPSDTHETASESDVPKSISDSTIASDYLAPPLNTLQRKPSNPDLTVGGWSKRAMDIVVASTALILLSPLFLMIGAVILMTLKRPVIFSHIRIGHGGKLFHCYKFRTMVTNGDEVLRRHIESSKAAYDEWQATHKLTRDPRVTPFGRLLRITSLDELPQLINIIRGDMSCVGPRPIVPDELTRYGDSAEAYLKARPGLTGAWQVSGRSTLKYDDRVALDRDYVENWSFWRDVRILFKTIPAVLRFGQTS